jgi:hypothetical protein
MKLSTFHLMPHRELPNDFERGTAAYLSIRGRAVCLVTAIQWLLACSLYETLLL